MILGKDERSVLVTEIGARHTNVVCMIRKNYDRSSVPHCPALSRTT